MSFKRIWAISRRIFLSLLHEPRTIGLIIFAPIIAMFVFGLAFSGDVKDLKVVIVNNDSGFELLGMKVKLSEKIISEMDTNVLKITYEQNYDSAVNLVRNRKAYALIDFSGDFTKRIVESRMNGGVKEQAIIKINLDKSNYTLANTIIQEVFSSFIKAGEKGSSPLPVRIDASESVYGQNAKFMDFLAPGIMSFAVFFLTTLLTILAFVSERKTGMLERLLSTPLKESEIVTGYALVYGIIGMIQTAILILIALFVFKITVVGNIFLAFFVIFLLAVLSLNFGILISSVASSEIQAVQMVPLIVLPTFLLAGIFWPVEAIPQWIRPLSYLMPAYYSVDALRSIFIRGWGFDRIYPNIIMMVVFSTIFIIGATLSLKKNRR